ncbi:hypothetical protein COW36_24190 [bacterium (Candidatus Blackallbacteria) CG17_big_fil_post_rev_8_21_14_2_50_48_46]|uniref:Peptidase C45 hydrolase domain-containing protein n=1 Tax=bacterium (Candidatus Blackallbacteria) CG17_big_fil_post_rev_8_21_14_2_50_48_46 TaxID=2014261 RepID=A0A2M7FX03_9BACT|nr:MAG: hypothetical protein COW64_19130 [bacterium (Candidatus Blackallbacteria) CG18_big_fil_WC_8_21_14_2_50_49_26]PIW13771.1 MAG: hypothetical protein COW36_24190 [bacterium (Candidatus Blackallbacteria) CG17_big_fil_post_rev_8_21_14_2_50_48_46]PIW44997.1 MAG: hypothetical protein COW20_21820 [bacterium (Candidatus Blackallbacteria) CG13_big_fil_rev_8_21_14_2_50_49_14]
MSSQALQRTVQPLACVGTPFERGKTQGKELQRSLGLCFNAFFQSETFGLLKPRWLPQNWAVSLASWQARRQFLPFLRKAYPAYLEQMEGLAAGSGLPLNRFAFVCAAEILLASVDFQLGACSSLAIPAAFSATEEPVLVKNFDYPFFLRTSNLVRKTVPSEGFASLDLTLMPLTGCHTGLNQAGVAITYNYGYGQTQPEDWIPISIRVQEALRTCETARQAVDFFKDGKQAGGAIMTILDAQGEMFLLEISSGVVEFKQVQQNLLIATNHYQTSGLVPHDIPVNAYYSHKKSVPELAGKRVHESSEARFDRLYELTGTRIQFHEEDLKAYLSDHHRLGIGNDNTLCRHGDYFETTCSVVIKPRSGEIQVSLGNPCEESYQTYRLN